MGFMFAYSMYRYFGRQLSERFRLCFLQIPLNPGLLSTRWKTELRFPLIQIQLIKVNRIRGEQHRLSPYQGLLSPKNSPYCIYLSLKSLCDAFRPANKPRSFRSDRRKFREN